VRYYRLCENCRAKIETTQAAREIQHEVVAIIV